jgi:hypothetical protein
MKIHILIIFFFLAFNYTFSQETFKDTITLQEVKINKKEPKLITLKQGKGKQKIGNGFFKTAPEQAHLITELPYGTIQNIILHFMRMSMINKEGSIPTTKVESTTYELTLHEISSNKIGKVINDTPILVKLPSSRKSEPSVTVDLSTLHLTTDKFFVVLKRTSDLPCSECNFYIPMAYKSEKKLGYQGDIYNITLQEKSTPAVYPSFYYGLLCEIKTLTREY